MESINQDISKEMWCSLREGLIREWRCRMGADPDTTPSQVTLYSLYGALQVRFDRKAGRVKVVLRSYGSNTGSRTAHSPPVDTERAYEPVVTSRGRRQWRRGSYKHGEDGMARMIVYHLLKHRMATEGSLTRHTERVDLNS